jgi:hypothetical protein
MRLDGRKMRLGLALVVALASSGCREGRARTAPRPSGPVSIRLDGSGARRFAFTEAPGELRVTAEVVTSTTPPVRRELHDVLFPVRGSGSLEVGFRPASSENERSRIILRCRAGGEESEAALDWPGPDPTPGLASTFTAEPKPAAPGVEVTLAESETRLGPDPVRFLLKANFTERPLAPRMSVGAKAPR